MTAQNVIDLLADYPPHAEVTLSIDSFINGEPKSMFEGPIERVENVNGKPFLIGEKKP